MNPEDQQQPGTPQAGAPPVGPTDAEYQTMAANFDPKKQPVPPVAPAPTPKASGLSDFFDGLKKAATMPNEDFGRAVVKGAARGLGEAGIWAADKLNRAADATGAIDKGTPDSKNFIDKWMSTPLVDSKPMTEDELDGMLGEKEDGVEGFVEGTTQMMVGAAAAVVAAAPLGGGLLAGSVAGGIGATVTTDPYAPRMLSSALSNAPSWISTPVNTFLAADPKDPYPTALVKSALENVMTFASIDKLIHTLGVVHAKMTGGDVAAAQAKLAGVTHDPATQGPVIVHQTEDGKFALVDNSTPPETPAAPDRRAAPRDGAVDRRAVPRPDYSQMSHTDLLKAHIDLTTDALTQARIAQEALSRNEDAAITSVREDKVNRLMKEADHVQSLMDAKTGPVFETAAEAESFGASINESVLNKRDPLSVHLLSDDQVQQLRDNGAAALKDAGYSKQDYNFDYNAPPEEVHQTVLAMVKAAPDIGLPKAQTHAQTVALANDLFDGKTGDQVVQMMKDKHIATQDMPQYIVKAREMMNSTGQKIANLSQAADANPDNGVAFNSLREAMNHLMDMHESATGLVSTSGRALDANKIIVGEAAPDALDGTVAAPERAAGEAKQAATMKSLVNKLDKPDMLALARQIRMANGDPNAILQLIRAQSKVREAKAATAMSVINGVRVESMLSGIPTQVAYMVSHALNAVYLPVENWFAGAGHAVATELKTGTPDMGMIRQSQDQLAGLFMYMHDAWSGARRALNTGSSIVDPQGSIMGDAGGAGGASNGGGDVTDLSTWNPLNILSTAAHIPSRMLTTNAEFFKQLNYRASVRAQSLRLAAQDGVTDTAALAERVADDMKASFTQSGAGINPQAVDYSRLATFQNPLVGFGKYIQEGVQKFPALRLVNPFVRTPTNLFIWPWQRTPGLNLISSQIRSDFEAGGERAAQAYAKTALGMATWGGAAAAVYSKLITGGPPADPALKAQYLANPDNHPYSIRVPDGWVSYNRANPQFTAIGIVADLIQMSGELKQQDLEQHAAAFVASVTKNISNKTFMQGISETIAAANDGTGRGMMTLFDKTVGSFVPNIANKMNQDDTMREVRGMVDELRSRVPGWSSDLEARRNILGEPILKTPGYAQQVLNPFTAIRDSSHDDTQQQLIDLGKGMAMPPETPDKLKGQAPLTDRDAYDNGSHQSPYDRMGEILTEGTSLRSRLETEMKSDQWKNAGSGNELFPGGKRYIIAAKIISESQQRAFHMVEKEYPKLKEAMKDNALDKRDAIRTPPTNSGRPQFITQ